MIYTNSIAVANEDSVYSCNKFSFVLDGATGLFKEHCTDYPTDANWFSNRWNKFLQSELKDESCNLIDVLKKGVTQINKEYLSFEGAENIKSKPSSGLALIRKHNNKLEYFILGDCSLLVKFKNGKVKHITLEQLQPLDAANINIMVKVAKEKNINVIDARKLINDNLVATRNLQNKPNGYWILSDSVEAIDNGLHGYLPLEDIEMVFGFSDGMSQLFDCFKLYTTETFVDAFKNGKTFDQLYQELRKEQSADKLCNNVPRFKESDDATVFADLEF